MVIGPVKTASSLRTLALPDTCVRALPEQAERQDADEAAAGRAWANPHRLVFTTDVGTPLDPSNVRHGLQRIADTAGVGHVHPHLLRHAAASLLSEAGVRIEDIADTPRPPIHRRHRRCLPPPPDRSAPDISRR